ncbi:hypothetical protein Hanom_Chr17g01571031 [Helianthus anomalus]
MSAKHHLRCLRPPEPPSSHRPFSPILQPQLSSTSNRAKKEKHHLSLETPLFPVNYVRRSSHYVSLVPENPSKIDRKKKTRHRRRRNSASFSSITDNYYCNWWSNDEENLSP